MSHGYCCQMLVSFTNCPREFACDNFTSLRLQPARYRFWSRWFAFQVTGQEAQLSQRYRSMLRVIEYFAKLYSRSLKVIRNDTLEYGVCYTVQLPNPMYVSRTVSEIFSFIMYGVTSKSGLLHLKMALFDRPHTTTISMSWYHFRDKARY